MPLAVTRTGSETSNPNPSIHIPAIRWKVMFSRSSVWSPARKLTVRSPQSGG